MISYDHINTFQSFSILFINWNVIFSGKTAFYLLFDERRSHNIIIPYTTKTNDQYLKNKQTKHIIVFAQNTCLQYFIKT